MFAWFVQAHTNVKNAILLIFCAIVCLDCMPDTGILYAACFFIAEASKLRNFELSVE